MQTRTQANKDVEMDQSNDNHKFALDERWNSSHYQKSHGSWQDDYNEKTFSRSSTMLRWADSCLTCWQCVSAKQFSQQSFCVWFLLRTQSHPKPYMICQADINEDMQVILVDWLVQVHREFCLIPETLYLCTNTTDRYCSFADISIPIFLLVGIASLFLASKHEEIDYPDVKDYVNYGACSHQEFLEIKCPYYKLQVLNWRMSIPTVYHFPDRILTSQTKA